MSALGVVCIFAVLLIGFFGWAWLAMPGLETFLAENPEKIPEFRKYEARRGPFDGAGKVFRHMAAEHAAQSRQLASAGEVECAEYQEYLADYCTRLAEKAETRAINHPSEVRHELGDALVYLATLAAWVGGIAVAKGFWMTLGCVLIPPLAWVVLAMRWLS